MHSVVAAHGELPCPTTRHSDNGCVAVAALTGSGRRRRLLLSKPITSELGRYPGGTPPNRENA